MPASDEQSLHPDTFVPYPETVEQTEVDQELENKGKQLKSLACHPGWIRISEQLKERISHYRNLKMVDMGNLSKAEIGEKFLTSSLVADELEAILNQVEAEDGTGE